LAAESAKNELPVDRSVDRPTVIFDRWQLPVDRVIDRTQIQRATLSVRSTARSIGRNPRATCSLSVDRAVDWVKGQPACTYPCTSVDRYGRPATWYGWPSGRST